MTFELGGKPTADVGERDAVHVPIVVGVAGEQLCGGDAINYDADKKTWLRAGSVGEGMVADPFTVVVQEGEKFYACFPPGKVLDVRHVWSHPLLDGPSCQSIAWMKKWVEENGIALHPKDREKTTPYVWWMTQLNEVAAGERDHVTFWGDDCGLTEKKAVEELEAWQGCRRLPPAEVPPVFNV